MGERAPDSIEEAVSRYENDKDGAEWGEPVTPRRSKKLDVVVSVRFSPDELETVRTAAGPRGLSQFVRNAALRAAAGRPNEVSDRTAPAAASQAMPASNAELIFFDTNLLVATTPSTSNLRVDHFAA